MKGVRATPRQRKRLQTAGVLVTVAVLIWAILSRGGQLRGAELSNRTGLLNEARKDLESGNSDGAARLLRAWLAAHPADTSARILLGEADEVAGDFTGAESEFKRALKTEPANPDALVSLASLYDHQHRPSLAEPLLARAVNAAPGSESTRLAWATVLAELHRYPEAASAINGVPAPKPAKERLAFLRLKAAIASGSGKPDEAAREMESALTLAPESTSVRLAAGITELQASHWSRAAELLRPVYLSTRNAGVGLDLLQAEIHSHADFSSTLDSLRAGSPADEPPAETAHLRSAIGDVLLRAGHYSEALKDFQAAVAARPDDPAALAELGAAQLGAGDANAAFRSASRAAQLGDSAATERLLGDIEEQRGRSLDAVHSYQKAVGMNPDDEQYWLALGTELLRHETYKPALAVFEKAAEKFPHSLRIQTALGMTQYFLERYPQAIQTLVAASRLKPSSATPIEFLGQIQLQQQVTPQPEATRAICSFADAHARSGAAMAYCGALLARAAHDHGATRPPAEALRKLRLAARTDPSEGVARCELGKALEWAEQWKDARTEMQVCVRIEPRSAEGYYRLAEIDRHLGDVQGAREALKLHDAAVREMVASNARHDAALEKFLYSSGTPPPPK